MKKTLFITVLMALGFGLTACQQATTFKAPSQVLHWSEASGLTTMDPAQATDTLSFNVLLNTQEGLYRTDRTGRNAAPALAKKTTVSADGKTYHFHLRSAKWSNGDAVTASDFVTAWRRVVNPKTKAQNAFYFDPIKNAATVRAGKSPVTTLGVRAASKQELVVELERPVAYFKQLLAWPLFFPQNQAAVKQYGAAYGTTAAKQVYNGPFTLSGWQGTNDKWQLKRNTHYWDKDAVKLQKITDVVVKDQDTAVKLFKDGKIDQTSVGSAAAPNYLKDKARVDRFSANMTYVQLNQVKQPALKDIRLRQALMLAVDRKTLTARIMQNGALPATGFVPKGLAQNVAGTDFAEASRLDGAVDYQMKQAQTLAKSAARARSNQDVTMTLMVDDGSNAKTIAEYLQAQWGKLAGIKINLQAVPFAQRVQRQHDGDYELSMAAWQSVYADPTNFLQVWQSDSSYNTSGWHNEKYDALLKRADGDDATSETKRWADLVAAERVLMGDAAVVPLYQANGMQLLRPSVKGITFNPAGVPFDFKHAFIAKK